MNETFNLKRFSLLLRKQYAEHSRLYLMSLVVLFGMLMLCFAFYVFSNSRGLSTDPRQGDQKILFFVGLIFGGPLFTSMIFRELSDRAHGIFSITLPASHVEKFLTAWLYSFVLFLPAYLSVFYLADMLAVSVNNVRHHNEASMLNLTDQHVIQSMFFFAVLQSIAMLGAVSFRKWHFIKTAFVFIITLLVINYLNTLMASALTGEDLKGVSMPGFWGNTSVMFTVESGEDMVKGRFTSIELPPKTANMFVFFHQYLLAPLFWLTAFLKFREKQL